MAQAAPGRGPAAAPVMVMALIGKLERGTLARAAFHISAAFPSCFLWLLGPRARLEVGPGLLHGWASAHGGCVDVLEGFSPASLPM